MESTGPSLEESLASLNTGRPGQQKTYPTPPRMHWLGLLILAGATNLAGEWLSRRTGIALLKDILSSEVFLYGWLCVQAAFVQRLNPKRGILFSTTAAGALLLVVFLARNQERFAILGAVLVIAASLTLLVDLFRMRNALEDHYNGTEPYGLSLNGFWLLFFGPLYLQYHLLKIAEWKDKQV